MTKEEVLGQVEKTKIVPVVKLDRPEDAKPLCKALCAGGLPAAEITFRTAAAEEAIRIASEAFPEMLIGAGTVTNTDQAERALNAGAKFLVSPGFSAAVTKFAVEHEIMIFPGICTPTELMAAMEFNLPVVKFFPAEQYGGVKTIKALGAPFPAMRFMPTGGINASNIMEYLSLKQVVACGGSWMVKGNLIDAGDFGGITRLTREAVELVGC
jgi:2-dehydro-3-deoxyphosphogluconate aldolase/(4S)-4-hydroxy-2-oxoglutarate aldolase